MTADDLTGSDRTFRSKTYFSPEAKDAPSMSRMRHKELQTPSVLACKIEDPGVPVKLKQIWKFVRGGLVVEEALLISLVRLGCLPL